MARRWQDGTSSCSSLSQSVRAITARGSRGRTALLQVSGHIPPGEPENVQFIEISVNALDTHIEQHGDFVADGEADCFDEGDDDGDENEDGDEARTRTRTAMTTRPPPCPTPAGPSQWNLVMGVLLTVLGMAGPQQPRVDAANRTLRAGSRSTGDALVVHDRPGCGPAGDGGEA